MYICEASRRPGPRHTEFEALLSALQLKLDKTGWEQDNVDDSIIQHEVHDGKTFEPPVLRNRKTVRSRADKDK